MRTRKAAIWVVAWAAASLVAPVAVLACLWDSDTLRAEAQGLPGLVEIITGRFERPPNLYYEMRLERVAAQAAASPDDLALYDDAGVACDRLGRSDEAIDWMRRKKEALDRADPDAAATREHLYRYYANLGTFHAHRWLRGGADREFILDLSLARDLIAFAIELNPDAHFGRERYQLMAIEWLLNPPPGSGNHIPRTMFDAPGHPPTVAIDRGKLRDAGLSDAAEGLAGLITLGEAWESLDVCCALAVALNDEGNASLAYLARLRCRELINAGARSLHPDAPSPDEIAESLSLIGRSAHDQDEIAEFFEAARAEAEHRRTERTAYMLARLRAGEHPDTHPDFWSGFAEVAPPAPPNGMFGLVGEQRTFAGLSAVTAGVLASTFALLSATRRVRRRATA